MSPPVEHIDDPEFDDTAPPKMLISQEELNKTQIMPALRDYCAHLLPELQKCRRETWYLPHKCANERAAWMKCQYDDFQRRTRLLTKRKEIEERLALEKRTQEALDL